MRELHLFTKLDHDSYLTEDGYSIEVKELDGFLVRVSSSLGLYSDCCDTVHVGIIESFLTDQLGLVDLEVR